MNPLKAPQVATDEPSAKQILSTINDAINKELKDAMIVSIVTTVPPNGSVRQVLLQALEKVSISLEEELAAVEHKESMHDIRVASFGDAEREHVLYKRFTLQDYKCRVFYGDSVVPPLYGRMSEVAKALGEQVLSDLAQMMNDPRGQQQSIGQKIFQELALGYKHAPWDGVHDLAPTNIQRPRHM